MNANMIINMVMRMFMRKVVGKGIDAGMDMVTRKRMKPPVDTEQRQLNENRK